SRFLSIKRREGAKRSDLPHTFPFPGCARAESSTEPVVPASLSIQVGTFFDELASRWLPHSRLNPQRMTGVPAAAPKKAPPGFRPPPRTTKRKTNKQHTSA